jgi:peptide/nickel transport system permease protein
MLKYIARRLLLMIPTLILISIVSFFIIELPPGDFMSSYAANLAAMGDQVSDATLQGLRESYGLDQPIMVRYWKWVTKIILYGDFGLSFEWNQPVSKLIWERLALTLVVSAFALVFTWVIAFPIGILSAVKQYSVADYVATFFGFLGLAVPEFLLALVLMVLAFTIFGIAVGGLFSTDYADAPWSWGKVVDMLQHIWIPMIILGLSRTASLIRVLRANLLDELQRPYVVTARAKGQEEKKVLLRYPVRAALSPFVSTVGWELPNLISGATIVSVVLSLPTTGPLLLSSLMAQDMYLAGSFILMLSVLTLVGTLISDILLAFLDPRIRLQYEK